MIAKMMKSLDLANEIVREPLQIGGLDPGDVTPVLEKHAQHADALKMHHVAANTDAINEGILQLMSSAKRSARLAMGFPSINTWDRVPRGEFISSPMREPPFSVSKVEGLLR